MLILTSPAKRLDFESDWAEDVSATSQPTFLAEANTIARKLAQLSQDQLAKTLSISQSLAELNTHRFQNWQTQPTKNSAKPAILAYQGDVYQQLTPKNYSPAQQTNAQHSLRIISGLYGILKPYDLIQPYRLEMKTKLKVETGSTLVEFWRPKLTTALNTAIANHKHQVVLNLASQEYAAAIDFSSLTAPVITVNFKYQRQGKLKSIGILAKRSRGQMIQFLISRTISDRHQLADFQTLGYQLQAETATSLTFVQTE